MKNKDKQKLIKLLFFTDEITAFMCNDLFQELKNLIPTNICISYENLPNEARRNNLNRVNSIVINFLYKNKIYADMVCKFYNEEKVTDNLIKTIVTGYVFYIATTNDKYKDLDIFKDKRSICYTDISLLDVF